MTTVTLTSLQTSGLQAELNAFNAAQPEGTAPITLDQFVQALVSTRADSAVQAYDGISVFDFVQRFTTAEYDAVKVRAATDPNCAALLDKLRTVEDGIVHLSNDSAVQGLAYLVSVNILTADRAAVIGAIS